MSITNDLESTAGATTSNVTPSAVDVRRARRRGDRGFTLIELMVVVATLGILAGVTTFAVGGFTDTAHARACITEQRAFELAVQGYFNDQGSYPTTEAALVSGGFLRSVPQWYQLRRDEMNDDAVIADGSIERSAAGTLRDCDPVTV